MARYSISEFIAATGQRDRGEGLFELEQERLLEVNLDGMVWTKTGSMVAYRPVSQSTMITWHTPCVSILEPHSHQKRNRSWISRLLSHVALLHTINLTILLYSVQSKVLPVVIPFLSGRPGAWAGLGVLMQF